MTDPFALALMRNSPDPLIVSDLDSRILQVNPATERVFGWTADELVGHLVGDRLYPPNLRDPGMRALATDVHQGSDRYLDSQIHVSFLHKDGFEIAIGVIVVRGEVDGTPVLFRYIHDERVAPEVVELTQSERRFRKIMESSHELLSLVRPGGDWVFSSLGGPLGFPPGYMPPAGILSLVHPDDYEIAEEALDQLAATDPQGGTAGTIELRVRTVSGDYLWLENTGVNLLADPDVGALVLQSRDVTARHEADEALAASTRQLEESTRQLRSVLARFPAGVWLEDEHHHLVMVNQVQCDLFDIRWSPDDLVGIDCDRVLADHKDRYIDGDGTLERRQATMAAGVPDLDVELALTNGKTVLRDYVPLYAGPQIQGHLWIFRDITERKQLEHDQEQTHRQLAEQNQSLLELDRLKTELVATVSHELRTPLTSIISFAELLLDTDEVDVVNQRRFTEIIANNAHRLLVVVGDLLLLGRAEAGNLRLQPGAVEIPAIVDEVVAALEPSADAAEITLSVTSSAGPTIDGDAARLDQVLDNLVSNAIKFTPAGGEVHVTSSFEDGGWLVTVADTGMGIPRAEQATIFERFQRATNAATTPGTGLGLAVAKTLVELHGGTITIESTEGSGTTVTLSLPTHRPPPGSRPTSLDDGDRAP